jgi:hypothetical protein
MPKRRADGFDDDIGWEVRLARREVVWLVAIHGGLFAALTLCWDRRPWAHRVALAGIAASTAPGCGPYRMRRDVRCKVAAGRLVSEEIPGVAPPPVPGPYGGGTTGFQSSLPHRPPRPVSPVNRQRRALSMWRPFVVLAVVAVVGCGPSAGELREQTLSTLNTEADRWDGGKEFTTTATDAYGRPLSWSVEKGILSYTLEVRSSGPDGLPKNSDDLVVTRSRRHGESSLTDEASRAAEGVASGAASGAIKGIKKGLGLGGDKK